MTKQETRLNVSAFEPNNVDCKCVFATTSTYRSNYYLTRMLTSFSVTVTVKSEDDCIIVSKVTYQSSVMNKNVSGGHANETSTQSSRNAMANNDASYSKATINRFAYGHNDNNNVMLAICNDAN